MTRLLGILAALLILVQSTGSISMSAPTKRDYTVEVHQRAALQSSFADVVPPIILPTFLFYWVVQSLTFGDALAISYRNCQAFSVNPFCFSSYYVHLSALAP